VDFKFETLRNRDNCGERRFGWGLSYLSPKLPPETSPQIFHLHVVHINELAIGRFHGVLIILFISVSFLLLLACVNVAILFLARGEARQMEIALRKALGAGPSRIVGQLLTESLLLSLAGGGCGVILALGGIQLVRHFMLPTLFPPEAEIALNLPVLSFSVAVSVCNRRHERAVACPSGSAHRCPPGSRRWIAQTGRAQGNTYQPHDSVGGSSDNYDAAPGMLRCNLAEAEPSDARRSGL
jgi:hypothetical protein